MDGVYRLKRMLGLRVFVGLLVLDLLEYFVGSRMNSGALIPLAVLAVPSTWLIVRFYMHFAQLRQGGGH
ncbi:MAG: hypothetical protein ACYC06_02920 [Ilumatobacteraceae bacterium]